MAGSEPELQLLFSMETHEQNIEKVAKLIKDIKFAMLTTADTDGTLRSRPMATQKTPFDGTLWFFTKASSPKVEEVEKSHQVNLSYAAPDSNSFVSVSGLAVLVRDKKKAEELWNPLYKAWFPQGLEDPELALLKVHVEKAEYWDSPASTVVQIAGFVKAIATGQPYQANKQEHDKVQF